MNILNKFEIIKQMAEHRYFYECKELNSKNERLIIEITECYYDNSDNLSLPKLWVKNGYTNKIYNNVIVIDTFCYDSNGDCYGKYNPTIKLSNDKLRYVINFDWLLDVSEDNIEKLLNEIYKRFMRGV